MAQERRAQKSRTREALLAGARTVLARGAPLSITDAAKAAGISKATAYRYFSDPHAMAAEAGLAVEVKSYEEITEGAATPHARVIAVSLYLVDLALAHEAQFRQFIARSQDAWRADDPASAQRGGRRVALFDAALTGTDLPAPMRRNLVLALSSATGVEAMIAARDAAGATPEEARQVVQRIAEALLAQYRIAPLPL